MNDSLVQGIFPDQWKISTVTPIPKLGNTNIACDSRPINELPLDEKKLRMLGQRPTHGIYK